MWFQFFMWVVSFVIADYFRERLPSQTASGIGDFNIPTATEGRVVPIITGGSIRCNSLNCIWYGDFAAIERTVTTGVIFKEDETIGFTYELALQYAICKTKVAGIIGIWIGDDEVFNHDTDAGGIPQQVVDVDRDDLFGGTDNGGGFQGRIRLFNGDTAQAVSAFLSSRINPLPAYRGTAYIMVTSLDETVGATIGESNNLRYIRVAVQAFDTVANGSLGDALTLGNNHHFIGPDANPVSVAYDLFTNTHWGRSFSVGDMDVASFVAAAETVWAEGIGYSQIIDETTSTGEIQDTIEQHIDGYIGPNAVSGRIEVKLARLDYVLANEYQANDANVQAVKSWKKADWSQTFNRIRIRYTDRAKQWKETHAVELAAGNRVIQGKTVTKELRYQGVHTAAVASKIAARIKYSLAKPSSGGTIVLDRSAYQLRPGSVFSFTSAKVAETNLAVRVTKATIGNVDAGDIELEVVSDQFDTEIANNAINPPSDFVPPIQVVIPFAATDQAALEAPAILMAYSPTPNALPRIATLARRAVGNTPTEYEVVRRVRNPPGAFGGSYTSTDVVRGGFTSVGTLRAAATGWQAGNGTFAIDIDPLAAESLDALIGTYSAGPGNAAGIAVISPGLADEEFIFFDAAVDSGAGIQLTGVSRAAMDTPMWPHALGAQVWFIWTGGLGMGPELYNIGDGVDLKFLPRSPSSAVLEPAATSLPEVLMDEATSFRATKPLLPYTATINTQVLPATVDFEYLIVAGPNAGLQGAEVFPTLRDWRNLDIAGSVAGLDAAQGLFNDADVVADGLQVAWWLHDIDTFPTAPRTSALALSAGYVAQATASDQFDVLKSVLVAAGAEGFSFAAMLEIETRHSAVGAVANQVSHKSMQLPFTAAGIFSVPPDVALLNLHFDGADASTLMLDGSRYRRTVEAVGNAQNSTVQSVFGGSSLLVNAVGDYVLTPSRRGWDMRGDWTIEFRAWFTSEPSFPMIFEQWDGAIERGIQVYYNAAANAWQMNYSTTGANLVAAALHTTTWIPTLATWYAVAIVKKGTSYSTFIDGTKIGASSVNSAVYFRTSLDFQIGGGGDGTNLFDGHIEEFRIHAAALYGANYTIAPLRFQDAATLYPLLAHFDDTLGVTQYASDDLNHYDISIGGTSEIDTAQSQFGGSSLRCDGVGNLTVALCDGAWLPETVGFAHPSFDFKYGEFTMECFFRFAVAPVGSYLIAKNSRATGGRNDWSWGIVSATAISFSRQTFPANQWATQGSWQVTVPTMTTGVWYHAAMVRVGNDLHFYFQGLRVGLLVNNFAGSDLRMFNNDATGQDPLTSPGQPVTIGRIYSTTSGAAALGAFNGWIDEVNIEKRAKYNGSSYTIPAAPLTNPVDGATDDLVALQWSGNTPSQGFATDYVLQTEDLAGRWLLYAGQASGDHITAGAFDGPVNLGSTFFDSNGDYVLVSRSKALRLGGGDFTLEGRIRFTTAPTTFGGRCLVSHWRATGNLRGFGVVIEDSLELAFHWSTDGINDFKVFAPFNPALNTWYHIAVVRSGANVHLFVDGVLLTNDGASDAITTDIIYDPQRQISFGLFDDTAGLHYHHGNMNNFLWTRAAKWTSGFTPPASLYAAPELPRVV